MELTEEIKQYNEKNCLYYASDDESEKWATYAQYYGHKHGMKDPVYLNLFSTMCSGLLGGMFISYQVEELFKERIEYDILERIGFELPEDKKDDAFEKIFVFINNRGQSYERNIYQHVCSIPVYHRQILDEVKGNNHTAKVKWLLREMDLKNLPDEKTYFGADKVDFHFNLPYSINKKFMSIDSGSSSKKLIRLINAFVNSRNL